MPINSKHPIYDARIQQWQRCRDAADGQDAVKAKGKIYLPKPGGLDTEQFEAYKTRALYYEAVARTIEGFVGAISRIDPVVEVPEKLSILIDDITADGMPLNELSKAMCGETILQGRGGILVDYDETLARAYLSIYQAEAITNWSDNRVVLHEHVYEPDPEDKYKTIAVEQYRELSLEEGVYTVTRWRKGRGANALSEWVSEPPVTPTIKGQRIDTLPFFWLTPFGDTPRVDKPPLLGLVNVCLSHYMNSADLEHGRHFTGLPTLCVTGSTDTDSPIRVGSLAAIVLNDANAKVFYAEFTGQGLGSLENGMAEKERLMAALGAAVFHDGPKGVEAAETARIRTSGETTLLSGVTTAVEVTLRAALECAAKWMGVPDKIEVTLNREFIDTKLNGPTLTALVQAFQAGALSLQQFLYNMQQGELLSPDTDIETEVAVTEAANAKRMEMAAALAAKSKPQPGA